ncbi:MAG TPA: ABC transporter ATP-binding protein [Jiangellaceae bacterium]
MSATHHGPLLEVDGLGLDLLVGGVHRSVLRDVSFTVAAGEAVGLVGESGSGKSMTVRAIDRLLPAGARRRGSIRFAGQDVEALSGAALRAYRAEVSVVFQDPRVHINPVRQVGDFMTEVLRTNRGVKRREAARRAVAMLAKLGISDGERRLEQYPHELSGGLLQRVMIASALLTEPRLLLADEPTTALDVTTQAEIMGLLDELRQDLGLSLLFITHDLDLAAAVCDRTGVMYAGEIVEVRQSGRLHDDPLHPYTAALGAARPLLDRAMPRLTAVPGRPLSALQAPADACAFAGRCPHKHDVCVSSAPALVDLDGGAVRCARAEELRGVLGGSTHV